MVDILELIPEGHANAVDREYLSSITGLCDRKVRQLIEEACTRATNELERNQISLSELSGWKVR